jgi:hypothetical protein
MVTGMMFVSNANCVASICWRTRSARIDASSGV